MARKKKEKPQTRIAVIDFETDPFLYDRVPEPFSAGFYDGETYIDFWGDDCADQLICYLESRKDNLIIYAHNGGKFDFYYGVIGFIYCSTIYSSCKAYPP